MQKELNKEHILVGQGKAYPFWPLIQSDLYVIHHYVSPK